MPPKMPVLQYSQTFVPFTTLLESGKRRMEGMDIESGGGQSQGKGSRMPFIEADTCWNPHH